MPGIVQIITSYAFFQFDTTGRGDGFAFPVVDLGWTLNYEMMFYVLFAAFIGFGRERCVLLVSIVLGAMILLGIAFPALPLPFRFWTQAITLEFVIGMWLALLFLKGRLKLPAIARVALCAAAAIVLAVSPAALLGAVTPNSLERVIFWGLPTAALLVAAVSGPLHLGRALDLALQRVGDSSYSLYLTHPIWQYWQGSSSTCPASGIRFLSA